MQIIQHNTWFKMIFLGNFFMPKTKKNKTKSKHEIEPQGTSSF